MKALTTALFFILIATLAGCSSTGVGSPLQSLSANEKPAAQPTAPGRTFLVLIWRAKFVRGIQTGDIAFTQPGQTARVLATEEFLGKLDGQPYHAHIWGACASVDRDKSNKEFTVQASAAGRCRIVVRDSLENANTKILPIEVLSSPTPSD